MLYDNDNDKDDNDDGKDDDDIMMSMMILISMNHLYWSHSSSEDAGKLLPGRRLDANSFHFIHNLT